MYLTQSEALTSSFEKISENVIREHMIPVLTKTGILIGPFLIKNIKDKFIVTRGKKIHYRTYTKVAAMILARMLMKKFDKQLCMSIIDADKAAFFAKNDLEIYRKQYEQAELKNNHMRMNILSDRFDFAENRYNKARSLLQKTYYSLF